jgi:hypothetical protein
MKYADIIKENILFHSLFNSLTVICEFISFEFL